MMIPVQVQRHPRLLKLFLNRFAPFKGAGIHVDSINLEDGIAKTSMSFGRHNENMVGTQFGGSLYAMVDPFYMLILMYHLGREYIVWDKASTITFLSPGRSAVHAEIKLDRYEFDEVRQLAADYTPILRTYTVSIYDELGIRIAEVEKVLYIRRLSSKRRSPR